MHGAGVQISCSLFLLPNVLGHILKGEAIEKFSSGYALFYAKRVKNMLERDLLFKRFQKQDPGVWV